METSQNKSLLKKILYVVVTLLPMAVYMVIYMPTFFWVESLEHPEGFHIIHTAFDDMIPVIEVFIIPYALWLPYLVAGMIAIAIRSRVISRKTSYMLMSGMTLFIIISLAYPNALELRTAIPDRDNIFMICINYLHQIDTPTDVLPSLHVYDALAVAAGLHFAFRDKKVLIILSDILCLLITLSTVFIKQHSIIDVIAAFVIFLPVLILICFVIRPVKKADRNDITQLSPVREKHCEKA
ncbi:MAG: phosphoesterase [Saccharofermentans sp.]|nr:phosphoesterase [Saccharofermentans sp.]